MHSTDFSLQLPKTEQMDLEIKIFKERMLRFDLNREEFANETLCLFVKVEGGKINNWIFEAISIEYGESCYPPIDRKIQVTCNTVEFIDTKVEYVPCHNPQGKMLKTKNLCRLF